jgi:predicted RND superfamily exporter protein
LARFDYKHKGIVVTFMLTLTVIFGLGILNLKLETDPQSLWVSHDSEGYIQ